MSRIDKIIYVDMDDVLCDFKGRRLEMLKANPAIAYPQSQYGFFANLKHIGSAIDSVNILRSKFKVYVLTRPSYLNPLCYTEKRVWIEKHFGLDFCEDLIICSNKALLKGDYLIDDQPWKDFEGKQLLFGSNEYPDWNSIMGYFVDTYFPDKGIIDDMRGL